MVYNHWPSPKVDNSLSRVITKLITWFPANKSNLETWSGEFTLKENQWLFNPQDGNLNLVPKSEENLSYKYKTQLFHARC